ncbi:hypothetical protein GE061_010106 [Apolygus lucorum]|uniref:Uncharacterized protein n=1 Tax=Apolygus lucorum TaxID=248454 RepID=A0A8S9Y3E8_APOLU|nr:hypothetical protein GE061_010106 [Apolygus lucorum]
MYLNVIFDVLDVLAFAEGSRVVIYFYPYCIVCEEKKIATGFSKENFIRAPASFGHPPSLRTAEDFEHNFGVMKTKLASLHVLVLLFSYIFFLLIIKFTITWVVVCYTRRVAHSTGAIYSYKISNW